MDNKPNCAEGTNPRIQMLMEEIRAVRFSDLDREYQACEELLALSHEENNTYGVAFAYAYQGDCLIGKNESMNASGSLMRAKELCEKHRFLDLLPYVCTWLGLYYEMQNDRQLAMHYYLDALEFAERNQDLLRQSILLNNIASQFQNCGSFQMAKEYYVKAFNCFNNAENADIADPHYAQMTANIISACCRLKQIDDAKYYYQLLRKSGQRASNQSQLYLSELLIAATEGDINATYQSVEKFLAEGQSYIQDVHQFFETLLVVVRNMVALNEEEYAHRMLLILDSLCQKEEYGNQLKVQYIWMQFYQLFGTPEEKAAAYERFYELRQKSDTILNRNLAEGLLSKIKLRESMKKNQEMAQDRERLEGEVQLDELTGLYNRRSMRELTERAAADRQVKTIGFLMLDVDYFKQYNDTYGHTAGDEALRVVARSMADAAQVGIDNFRYGGDEFAALCRNKTKEEVERYITSVSDSLRRKAIAHESSCCGSHLTLSIGYSFYRRREGAVPEVAQMMAEADKALYHAKDAGRNCYRGYTGAMDESE